MNIPPSSAAAESPSKGRQVAPVIEFGHRQIYLEILPPFANSPTLFPSNNKTSGLTSRME